MKFVVHLTIEGDGYSVAHLIMGDEGGWWMKCRTFDYWDKR